MPTIFSTPALLLCALYHHHHPVSNHCIHHHIEYSGGERISLNHSTISLKCLPVVAACPCHHCQPPTIRLKEPIGLGAQAVTIQDLNAPGPLQGVVRLVQVQGDHVQDLLPQLLKHLGLEDGGTYAATRPKYV